MSGMKTTSRAGDVSTDGYEAGYADAAGDPMSWHAPDKAGEPLHIGDSFRSHDGEIRVVQGFVRFADDGYGTTFLLSEGVLYGCRTVRRLDPGVSADACGLGSEDG